MGEILKCRKENIMFTHKINSKMDIRYFIVNGIAPRKTLSFDVFGEIVSVTLTYDDELEDVYVLKTGALKKSYYDFDKLVADIERIFDTLNA